MVGWGFHLEKVGCMLFYGWKTIGFGPGSKDDKDESNTQNVFTSSWD